MDPILRLHGGGERGRLPRAFLWSAGGFTLLELLVVVVIIGIIAGTAIPSFGRAAERSRVRDAQAVLAAIFSAERIYRLDNNLYAAEPDPPSPGYLWTNNRYLSDPNAQTTDWIFRIASPSPGATFSAVATRQGGSYNGRTVEVTDSFDTQSYRGTHPLRSNPI